MEEIWKDVVGYEGLYQVSNLGRVKTVARKQLYKDGSVHFIKERILSVQIGKRGYYVVNLSKNGTQHTKTTHRLIADAFIPNPENKPCVDHIDGNRLNNSIENLRYVTHGENMRNPNTAWKAWRPEIRSQNISKILAKRKERGQKFSPMTVYAYHPDGSLFRSFYSMGEAGRHVGRDAKIIQEALERQDKLVGGYIWSKEQKDKFPYVYKARSNHKPVQEIDEEGNVLQEWDCAKDLFREIRAKDYVAFAKFIRERKPFFGRMFRYRDDCAL